MSRVKLVANEGMVLTNGENYGVIIYLAEGAENNYHEITLEEYKQILAKEAE